LGSDLIALPALGAHGPYAGPSATVVPDVAGQAVAELSLVGNAFVGRTLAALRKTRPLDPSDRLAALKLAATEFQHGTVGGLSASEYQHAVCRVSGVNVTAVREAVAYLAQNCLRRIDDFMQLARPRGAASGPTDPALHAGGAVWVRRAGVLGVHASGNHPGVNSSWLEALALGYRVAVRPSRREPLTAHRLVNALWSAGFSCDQLVVLPTDRDVADAVIAESDLAIVYGGADVMRKYGSKPNVLANGPGRSKMLITADAEWRDHVKLMADSVSRGGGTACTNTTAIFVEGAASEVAEAVAAELSSLPSLPPEHPEAVLPVQEAGSAGRVSRYVRDVAAGTTAVLGGSGVADELGDGSAVLRPAVHVLRSPDDPQAGVELPFPCVWIVPWTRDRGIAPLGQSLVLSLLGADDEMVDAALAEPGIRNVYVGPHATCWSSPAVPHDSYLGDFLMESKGFIAA
jgi:acyl-CoA reductase-like NAD-dependent aldehyde dehydrogenase